MSNTPWYDTTPTGLRLPHWSEHPDIQVSTVYHTRSEYCAIVTHASNTHIQFWYKSLPNKEPTWTMRIGEPSVTSSTWDGVEMTQENNRVLAELLTYLVEQGMRWGPKRRRRRNKRS